MYFCDSIWSFTYITFILTLLYSLFYVCLIHVIVYAIYILSYFIHRINFILYMYFCDIICICFYVQSVEHFVDIGL